LLRFRDISNVIIEINAGSYYNIYVQNPCIKTLKEETMREDILEEKAEDKRRVDRINKRKSVQRNKYTRRWAGKAALLVSAAAVLTVIIVFIINAYVMAAVKGRIISEEEASVVEPDCILVLGAGVWDNERPSHILEDRLKQSIELYKAGISDRLLMSGDHGSKDYDEVNVMKKYAVDREIPSEHVFMDHAGFSTYESLYRARDIFQAERVIIVTQEYHLYRALYIAERLGLEAYGIASDRRVYAGKVWNELREVVARVKDFFSCIIKPEPTYLGDVIPISGSGNLTND
jgi:SanA protein